MSRAFAARDPAYDGAFFVGVRTTGIFCKPSCPSRPLPQNTEFLPSARHCLEAGYRPCLRCRPLVSGAETPAWARELMERVEAAPETRFTARDLRRWGVTPERARRWFLAHHGMTFATWCRRLRLAHAFTVIRRGASLDDAVFESGYASHSGFREAVQRLFGVPPGRLQRHPVRDPLVVDLYPSPLGPLLLAAIHEGLVVLDFLDRRALADHLRALARTTHRAIVPGTHPHLRATRLALDAYFQGAPFDPNLPLAPCGTAFQLRVWTELRRIPHGETMSYAELARRIGRPGAHRAVARANASNRLCLALPCHRVVGKDGQLTGYGGGLWRKRGLLELERRGPSAPSPAAPFTPVSAATPAPEAAGSSRSYPNAARKRSTGAKISTRR
ncbi:MAG: methylated-DNA--[protein]-cysteine S-methyltransferase [Verrucomicrobiales bacterium]|nr:methylated-DNA--[protein]-cysteine S-methyltransferase [Verrucomicrobiales bacterium]